MANGRRGGNRFVNFLKNLGGGFINPLDARGVGGQIGRGLFGASLLVPGVGLARGAQVGGLAARALGGGVGRLALGRSGAAGLSALRAGRVGRGAVTALGGGAARGITGRRAAGQLGRGLAPRAAIGGLLAGGALTGQQQPPTLGNVALGGAAGLPTPPDDLTAQLGAVAGAGRAGGGIDIPTGGDFGRSAFQRAIESARSGVRSDFDAALREVAAREAGGQQALANLQPELASLAARQRSSLDEIGSAAIQAARAQGIPIAGAEASLVPFQQAAAAEQTGVQGDISFLRQALGEQQRGRTATAENLRNQLLSQIGTREAEGLANIAQQQQAFGLDRARLQAQIQAQQQEAALQRAQLALQTQQAGLQRPTFGARFIGAERGLFVTPQKQQEVLRELPRAAQTVQGAIDQLIQQAAQSGARPEEILPIVQSGIQALPEARQRPLLTSILLSRLLAVQQ